MRNLTFLVFFVDVCVEVSNGYVMCGCWVASKLDEVVWAMCMWGVMVGLSGWAPSFASSFVFFFVF